ncbi:DUF2306 domain-containing protein [Brevundimonas sp. FT23028]|uniref:DUF2306 domain-containing protein n=1 Tax=Brevundimonas sp. FT23028 TaxID=3393748 RepID=UPI003B587BD4
MKRLVKVAGFSLLVLMALGVALLSARYLIPDPAFPTPPVMPHLECRPWVVIVHVAGGVTALTLGLFQLITRRGVRLRWHRFAGRVYVLACLSSAVAGLWLALTTSAGPVASVGFGGLAVVWFFTTAMGWRKAVRWDLSGHRRWMIRSLSLTLAAVTLRILLPLAAISGLLFEDTYRAISFLCWLPNLLIAELWLRRVTGADSGAGVRRPASRRTPHGG